MMTTNGVAGATAKWFFITALVLGAWTMALAQNGRCKKTAAEMRTKAITDEKTKFCISGRRTRLTSRRISWR